MICDGGSKNMLIAEPYLGNGTTRRNEPLAQYYVEKLADTFEGTNYV